MYLFIITLLTHHR